MDRGLMMLGGRNSTWPRGGILGKHLALNARASDKKFERGSVVVWILLLAFAHLKRPIYSDMYTERESVTNWA